jgi:hypothetical protein
VSRRFFCVDRSTTAYPLVMQAHIASSLSLIKRLQVEQRLEVKSGQYTTCSEFSEVSSSPIPCSI